jgi:hypothetical protein
VGIFPDRTGNGIDGGQIAFEPVSDVLAAVSGRLDRSCKTPWHDFALPDCAE